VAIAIDRYVCICHPLRHATVATACRARVVVVSLAVITVILGLLGAASFSVYHIIFPITHNWTAADNMTTMPPASAADEYFVHYVDNVRLLDDILETPPFDSDGENMYQKEIVNGTCVAGNNETDCRSLYAVMNTGYCGHSHLILSATFVSGYLHVHSLIYPFCLLAVLVLYTAIYRSVFVRRARRQRLLGSSNIALTRPAAVLPASTPAEPTTGITTATTILYRPRFSFICLAS